MNTRTATESPDFDHAYGITADGTIFGPGDWPYIPTVEQDDAHDILIDSAEPAHSDWTALTGLTEQHGYSGAVMHASERWSPCHIEALTDLADAPGVAYIRFALVEVGAHDDTEPVFPDEPDYCEHYGCAHELAGWAVIYQVVIA